MTAFNNWLRLIKQQRKTTALDINIFLRQFATLISAGIPIIQSCDLLEKSQEKTTVRLVIYTIKREILAGKTLFQSLQRYPNLFDTLVCQLIQLGEHTGKLDTMLTTIANYQEKQLALKKRLQRALFYPLIISITALLVTLSMFIFIVPRFAELFQDMQEKLPLLTQWIFFLSNQLRRYFWLFLLGLSLLLLVIFHSRTAPAIKHYLRQRLLLLPVIKTGVQKIILARFARNLALTVTAGLPITDALKLLAKTSHQLKFTNALLLLRNKISSGMQLHQAMGMQAYFPLLMVQMIKVGEESGKLDYMLEKIADFLEADIDQITHYCAQLLEPLIMLALGVLIGTLVIGMYLPIFKLGSAL